MAKAVASIWLPFSSPSPTFANLRQPSPTFASLRQRTRSEPKCSVEPLLYRALELPGLCPSCPLALFLAELGTPLRLGQRTRRIVSFGPWPLLYRALESSVGLKDTKEILPC